jgi:hypothetical protein
MPIFPILYLPASSGNRERIPFLFASQIPLSGISPVARLAGMISKPKFPRFSAFRANPHTSKAPFEPFFQNSLVVVYLLGVPLRDGSAVSVVDTGVYR